MCRLCESISMCIPINESEICGEEGVWYLNMNISCGALGLGAKEEGIELVILIHPVIKGLVCSKASSQPPSVPLIFPSLPSSCCSNQSSEQPGVSYNPVAVLLIIPESCRSHWSQPTGKTSLCWLLPFKTEPSALFAFSTFKLDPGLNNVFQSWPLYELLGSSQRCSLLRSLPVRRLLTSFELHTQSTLSHPWQSLS